MDRYNCLSFAGLFVLMMLGWAASKHRNKLNVRCIVAGVGLQLLLGLLVFHAPGARTLFARLNDAVLAILTAATAGQVFVFGALADPAKVNGFVLATQALPLIIFFSALMALLYWARVMPWVIRGFARVFSKLMKISGAESLCAASNIFVGVESVTAVRPYLKRMTPSEYCTVLAAGMATVASSTMAVYVGFLHEIFPGIAGHLISASILSAPAAIVMSKILYPEDGCPETLGKVVDVEIDRESGPVEAIITGAMAGVRLVVGVCALLIAFMGMIALVDLGLGAVRPDWSLTMLLGYGFRPLAFVIGVPWSDCQVAGELLGMRTVATEIPAYQDLTAAIAAGKFSHPRSPVVIAYALCGFAHIASLAIFVGGAAALAPERRKDLAAVGPRALLAATLACLMTGAVAGVFFV